MYAYDNSLTGELPSSIWSAYLLIQLTLKNNNLYGSVPHNFFDKNKRLEWDGSNWLVESFKINCSCCDKSWTFWNNVKNLKKCLNENILNFVHNYDTESMCIKDVHNNDTVNRYYDGSIQLSTGCYEVVHEDWNNYYREKKWHFKYSYKN